MGRVHGRRLRARTDQPSVGKELARSPTTNFGDSGSFNHTKRNNADIVKHLESWLGRQAGLVTNYAGCGDASVTGAATFKDKQEEFPLAHERAVCDLQALEKRFRSARYGCVPFFEFPIQGATLKRGAQPRISSQRRHHH